jgi:Sec-independent protein translocase protein TatA
MMMRKATGAWSLIAVLILLFVACPSRAKEIYKWVDEKGTVHFAEDESSVPEEYREQLEKKSMKEDSKPPKARKQEGKGAKDQSAGKEKETINRNKIEGDVIESVKTVLSLWKDGKYDLLYHYGDQKSRMAVNKEEFERRMTKKGIGLASSWEAIRDIQVDVRSATLAYATVRIGLKSVRGGETKFRTETYRMSFEKGMWKISLTKILSAKL